MGRSGAVCSFNLTALLMAAALVVMVSACALDSGADAITSGDEAPALGSAPASLELGEEHAPAGWSYEDGRYLIRGAAGVAAAPIPEVVKESLLQGASPDGDGLYIVRGDVVEAIERGEVEEAESRAAGSEGDALQGDPGANLVACAPQPLVLSKTLDVDVPISTSFNPGGGVSATVSFNLRASGSVTGAVEVQIIRIGFEPLCIPIGVAFERATITGGVQLSAAAQITGTITGGAHVRTEVAKLPLGVVIIPLLGIPVGFNLPITVGLDVTAAATAQLNVSAARKIGVSFDYQCTLAGCSGSSNPTSDSSPSAPRPSASLAGRVEIGLWAEAAIRTFVVSESFAYAQIGVRSYLLGDLWGFEGNTCGDADGDGVNELVRARTFDLDAQTVVASETSFFGSAPATSVLVRGPRQHLRFWDLIDSTATTPMLLGPSCVVAGQPATFSARMRPCWPYNDPMSYVLSWGDGASTALTSPPRSAAGRRHTWANPGQVNVTLKAASDAHGRTLCEKTTRRVRVKAPAAALAGSQGL